jgi:hypothetical protein
LTATEDANHKSASVSGIRSDYRIADMLLKLEKQIADTLGNITTGLNELFPTAKIAEALSDRELLTLELWAGAEHEAIANEVEDRRAEYEKFVSRFGERAKS